MGRKIHYFHSVKPAQRAQAARNGSWSQKGPSVAYLSDGGIVVLQDIAKKHQLTVEVITARIKRARASGSPITMELITKPRRAQPSTDR